MSGNTLTFQTTTEFVIEECYSCGTLFAMTEQFKTNRLKDKASFYCPAGHSQCYVGKSDKELRREAEARAAAAEAQARAAETARVQADAKRKRAEAETKRLKARAAGGACPHCNRTFVQLARHVATKHPECLS